MSGRLQRSRIGDRISFNSVVDPKFKHNRLSVSFVMPLEREAAADNAVVPHILRKGCRELPDFTALNRTLTGLYGAVLDADVTKYGNYQILSVAIQGMDGRFALEGEDIAGECASLLAAVALDPCLEDGLFREADVALEKQYVIDTIQAEINDKRSYAVSRCMQEMCKGEPAAVRRYGDLDRAEAITPASATAAYRRMLRTAPVEILFCGPGNPDRTREIFTRGFQGVERDSFDYRQPDSRAGAGTVRVVTETMDLNQGKLVMGFRTGVGESREEINAARMFSALLGGTPFSKLFLNVREKLSLCYYCQSRFDVSNRLLLIDSGVEAANKERAREEILNQLEALRAGDFTDEELVNTKLLLKNAVTAVTDTLSSIEGWYLTQILRGQDVSPGEDAAEIDKVDREEIVKVAKGVALDTVYFLTGDASQKEGGQDE